MLVLRVLYGQNNCFYYKDYKQVCWIFWFLFFLVKIVGNYEDYEVFKGIQHLLQEYIPYHFLHHKVL